jgi:hypothetical protein
MLLITNLFLGAKYHTVVKIWKLIAANSMIFLKKIAQIRKNKIKPPHTSFQVASSKYIKNIKKISFHSLFTFLATS